ncbi:hypothetical protein HDU76_007956, partial [Blyttiomyces sp. JEL0837]
MNQDVWKFNYGKSSWRLGGGNGGPGKRAYQAFAQVGNEMYVWGGQDDRFNIKNDLWKYDMVQETWIQVTPSSNYIPEPRFAATMVSVNETVLVLYGGSDGVTDGSVLWVFDIPSNRWSSRAPSTEKFRPRGLSNSAAVVLDSRRILYVGGTSNKLIQPDSFIYNSGLNSWTPADSLLLPVASQEMSIVKLNQSEYANACVFNLDLEIQMCTPLNETAIVFYGGGQLERGIADVLWISFPEPEILPRDPTKIPLGITIASILFPCLGLTLCLAMSLVLTYFQNHKAFRSASIRFLWLYLFGAVLGNIGIIFYNIPDTNPELCNAALWCLDVGCMILFAAMAVKNLLVAFNWESPYSMVTMAYDEVNTFLVCASPHIGKWMWILLCPIGIMVVASLILSFETRNVASRYNESGHINAAIYVTALSLLILISIELTLTSPSTQHLITSLVTALTISAVIGINFVPRWFSAVQSPDDMLSHESLYEQGFNDALSSHKCKVCRRKLVSERSRDSNSKSAISVAKINIASAELTSNNKSSQQGSQNYEVANPERLTNSILNSGYLSSHNGEILSDGYTDTDNDSEESGS